MGAKTKVAVRKCQWILPRSVLQPWVLLGLFVLALAAFMELSWTATKNYMLQNTFFEIHLPLGKRA